MSTKAYTLVRRYVAEHGRTWLPTRRETPCPAAT